MALNRVPSFQEVKDWVNSNVKSAQVVQTKSDLPSSPNSGDLYYLENEGSWAITNGNNEVPSLIHFVNPVSGNTIPQSASNSNGPYYVYDYGTTNSPVLNGTENNDHIYSSYSHYDWGSTRRNIFQIDISGATGVNITYEYPDGLQWSEIKPELYDPSSDTTVSGNGTGGSGIQNEDLMFDSSMGSPIYLRFYFKSVNGNKASLKLYELEFISDS